METSSSPSLFCHTHAPAKREDHQVNSAEDVLALLSGSPSVKRLDIIVRLKELPESQHASILVIGKSLTLNWSGLRRLAVWAWSGNSIAVAFRRLLVAGVKSSGMHRIIQ